MRIAIDARLNAYRQGGIPQYTRQLLTALAEVARDDQLISLQHRDQLRPLAVAPNVARRTLLTPPHHRFEQWGLPLELLLVRPDVLHCPDFIAPVRRPCPAVVTIHDLAFMHYPEILDESARTYYGQIKTNAARADGIIAVSEATRQDVAQFLDIPIEEITVIHEAAAPLYGRLDLREGEARVLNATPVAAGTFMLFVSTLEPRKNLPTLLQALRICIDRRPDRRYLLVVAGARGWRDEQIFETVRELRLGDHVLFAGSVGQYDLRWLYNACRFYINPSLYEGFGLPLLEAMACGAACLAAATSSLPEIGGEAAIYIPPLDAGQWADAIAELWDDQERQEELGRLGRVQAQHFSWFRAARETLKVYERAIARARQDSTAVAPAQPHERRVEEPLPPTQPAILPNDADTATVPGVSGDARACLRCGTPMLAGQIQRMLALLPADGTPDPRPLAPQAWACPRCGHVELVVDQAEAARAEPVPAEQPGAAAQELAEPIALDSPDYVALEPTEAAAPIEVEAVEAHAPETPDALAEEQEHAASAALAAGQATSSNGVPAHFDLMPESEALAEPPPALESASAALELNGVADTESRVTALDQPAPAEPPTDAAPTDRAAPAVQPAPRRQSRSKRKRS